MRLRKTSLQCCYLLLLLLLQVSPEHAVEELEALAPKFRAKTTLVWAPEEDEGLAAAVAAFLLSRYCTFSLKTFVILRNSFSD